MPFVVIQLFRSVSSCPYRRDGVFVDTNLQQSKGLYLVNELATMEEVLIGFAWQQMKGYSSFVFSEDIQQFDSLFFWRLSMTFVIHLHERQASFCSTVPTPSSTPCQTLSISTQRRLHIWRVLEGVGTVEQKGLACETKWKVYKLKQIQHSSNKHGLIVQRSLIDINKIINSWHTDDLGRKKLPVKHIGFCYY